MSTPSRLHHNASGINQVSRSSPSPSLSLIGNFSNRLDRYPGLTQLVISTEGTFMSHVLHQYDLDLYAGTLVSIILSDMGMSRWNIIHENKFSIIELEYSDFVANFSFILPEELLEDTRADYDFLKELIQAHWVKHDYAAVHYPPVFKMVGAYYVFEISFDV